MCDFSFALLIVLTELKVEEFLLFIFSLFLFWFLIHDFDAYARGGCMF